MVDDRVSATIRRTVAERARFCCEYCWSQESYATQSFSVEHILPKSRDGKSNLDNLAFACQGCNGHKHAKTAVIDPATGNASHLFHPRYDRWQRHDRGTIMQNLEYLTE